jgi:GntR family transcriptional regulator
MQRSSTAYSLLAQSLRERILSGEWRSGARLITERELCRQFEVSRITVRRALQIVEEEGLVIRRQGSGTFVKARAGRRIPIVNGDFSASILRHAPELARTLKGMEWKAADGETAARLGIAPGDRILSFRRVDRMNRRPVATDEVFLPARFADRLSKGDLDHMAFLERWQEVQRLDLDYESQLLEAVPAAPPETRWLRIPCGAPLLKETNIVFLAGGRAAGLFISHYRHEYYQFNSMSRISDRRPAGRRDTEQSQPGGARHGKAGD